MPIRGLITSSEIDPADIERAIGAPPSSASS